MSEWMKEMERLVDSYGDMRAKAAEPLRVQKPYCSWIDGVATARAALLAHAAQRDVQFAGLPQPDTHDAAGFRRVYSADLVSDYGHVREAAGYARGLKEADKLLLEAPRWRDVADELPQEAQEVLFVRSGKTVHGAWIGGIFWHNNQKMAAAYWMPLPNPLSAALSGEVQP